jgi:Flp pilus assembly protein TadB
MSPFDGTGYAVVPVSVCFGLGVAGLLVGLVGTGTSEGPTDAARLVRRVFAGSKGTGIDPWPLVVALGVGALAVMVTGWIVAGPIAALAAYGLPRLLRQTSAAASIATLEAIASWTELLQGTLAASAGLGQAIIATADMSPAPIRDETRLLAAQLQGGVDPRQALLRFADAVGDPCADRVVCSLLLAFTERAQRLGDLLSALAESTREEVALRLRVETSRASVRSGVRTVIVFSVAFAGALALAARSYLAPYGTTEGQLVLAAVGGLYTAGLTLMVTLAKPPRSIRLLGSEVEAR